MKIHRIDHVSINVIDYAAAKAFFLDLGLELQGEDELEGGEWLDQLLGLKGVKTAVAFFKTADGGASIELVKYYSPLDEKGIQPSFANTLGIIHIAFEVDDIEAIVAKLKKRGTEFLGEIYNYENTYKLCYVRGPEGLILELAEKVK
jgi:catechol 2,3-dioxygenase-like lactoylglutathione lyase family enzyme